MIISARNLYCSIKGGDSLRGFSADFLPGVTAVIGQEGSGKSALLALLAGQARPEGGEILYQAAGGATQKQYDGSKGYLSARFDFPRHHTVEKVLLRQATAHKISRAYAQERVESVLRLLGLGGAGDMKIADGSADILRRMAIAAVLLPDPEVLLLENPFDGLLPQEQMRLSAILAGISRSKTVVYAVSDPAHAETGLDRVVFIHEGRCLLVATKDKLVACLRGKVWRVTVSQDEAWQIKLTHVVSDQQRVFKAQQLRVVSETLPAGAVMAVPEEPSVRDAYAWCLARGAVQLEAWICGSAL